MYRLTFTPKANVSPSLKRSCENGILISAVQPSESMTAFALHTGFQL